MVQYFNNNNFPPPSDPRGLFYSPALPPHNLTAYGYFLNDEDLSITINSSSDTSNTLDNSCIKLSENFARGMKITYDCNTEDAVKILESGIYLVSFKLNVQITNNNAFDSDSPYSINYNPNNPIAALYKNGTGPYPGSKVYAGIFFTYDDTSTAGSYIVNSNQTVSATSLVRARRGDRISLHYSPNIITTDDSNVSITLNIRDITLTVVEIN